MRHRLVLTVLAATLALGGAASAQSPAPSPVASPEPSATPFPWATLPPPGRAGALDRFEPKGRPDSKDSRSGVRIELWLSTPTAAAGEWVQAHVRITNTRDDAIWAPGGCSRLAHLDVDLTGVYAPGETWEGEAARFKADVVKASTRERDAFRILDHRQADGAVVTKALALADCNVDASGLARLGPGDVLDVDAAWYPADEIIEGVRIRRPLPAGTVAVTARYDLLGHGAQPDEDADPRPATTTATLELTGDGPAFPSPGELVDSALRDPAFAAWVAASPGGLDWQYVYLTAMPGPTYPDQPRYAELGDRAPNGVAEVWLVRQLDGSDAFGIALLDPWTGENLGFALQCGNNACPEDWPYDPTTPSASPMPSMAPSASAP